MVTYDIIKMHRIRRLARAVGWVLKVRKEGVDELGVFSSVLVDIFECRTEVRGKVDLQKTIYFAKRLGAPVPFDFRWNILGPYSYGLAHYSHHLVIEGLLHYSGIYSIDSEMGDKYKSRSKPETVRRFKTFFEKLEETCDEKNYDKVFFVECAASLDFIRLNVSKERRTKEEVFTLLEQLKPRKKERFGRMREEAWNLLVDENLVK